MPVAGLTRTWHRLRFAVPRQAVEEISNLCFEQGSCGLETREEAGLSQLTAWFPVEANMAEVRHRLAAQLIAEGIDGIAIEAGLEEERDWIREWRRFFKPVWATPRIVVHPSWTRVDTNPGEIAIAIEPEMAFGTGGHESTQLVLEAMEAVPSMVGSACLDLGTGSGVLAIAAALMGARAVVAVDIDQIAVENAERNIELNLRSSPPSLLCGGERSPWPQVMRGSVEIVAGQRFDLILANLESQILRPMLTQLRELLSADGMVIFSGLLARERSGFRQSLREAGLSESEVYAKGDWICCAAGRTSTVQAGRG